MAKRIEVAIIGDSSSLSRALKDATDHSSRFGGVLSSLGKAAILGLGAVGVGAAITGKKMLDLASDAAEVQSKMEVVFGKALPGLTKNMDAFSVATGASKFALREQAADMGALLAPLLGTKQAAAGMSEQFVKLATDLGSFNNVPVGDALLAIRSGLVGESEPLRRFGVLLNESAVKAEGLRMGLVKTNEVMTEQEKVMARASLIMQQTSLAQGDAERTAGSMANQMKALKNNVIDAATSMGEHLIPAALGIVGTLNKVFAAKGFEAKLNVVWTGVSEAAQSLVGTLRTALLGEWVRGPKMEVGGEIMVFKAGLAQEIGTKLAAVDWKSVGNSVAVALSNGLEVGGELAGRLVVVISKGFKKAVAEIDWSTVGTEMGIGIGKGTTNIEKQLEEGFGPRIGKAIARGVKAAMPGGGKILDLLPLLEDEAKAAELPMTTAGKNVGAATKKGIGQGIQGTAAQVGQRMTTVAATAGKFIGMFQGIGLGLGTALGSGIKSGLESALSGLGAAMVAKVNAAVAEAKAAAEVGSPSKLTEREIGKPLGQGVIDGWIKSTAILPEKMSATLKAAIEKARAAIESARDRLGTAFDALTSRILRAFDAESAGFETTHEKILREIDDRRQMEDLVQRQADAQLRLNEAIKEGDAAAIAAAQRDLTRATEDIARVDIEAKAAEERKNLDSLREEQRIHLEKKLAALEASFVKEGASVKKAMLAMSKLMASFGIDFETAGALVGEAFVAGLKNALGVAAAAAAGVGRAVPGPSSFSPGPVAAAAGGGNTTIVFPNYIGNERDLEQALVAANARVRARGGLA